MAHNALVRNPVTNWTNGSTILASELSTLDQNLQQAINAVDGGCWGPQSAITINGSGMNITGPLSIRGSARLVMGATSVLQFLDNDFPQYGSTHSGRSRTIVYPCAIGKGYPHIGWRTRFGDCGVQATAGLIDLSDGNGPQPPRFWVPLRLHAGATLNSVTLNFRIGFAHTQLPPVLPSARVMRMSNNTGSLAVPLTSVAAGATGPDGYVFVPKVSTVGAWSGQQSLTIACDQNNVIDPTQYQYFLEIIEENGLQGYPWSLVVKSDVYASSTGNVTGSNITTLDGVTTPAAGFGLSVILLKDQTNQYQNGLHEIVTGGNLLPGAPQWIFVPADFVQGMVFPVQAGKENGGTYWQVSSSVTQYLTGPGLQYPTKWSTGQTVVAGQIETASYGGLYFFKATATGTTGGAEPAWPQSVGATVVDNGITWTNVGLIRNSVLTFVSRGPFDDETPANAGRYFFSHGNIYQSVTASLSGIVDGHFQ